MLRRALIPLSTPEAAKYGYRDAVGFEAVVTYDHDRSAFVRSEGTAWPPSLNGYSYMGRLVTNGEIQEIWCKGKKKRFTLKDLLDVEATLD